MMIVLTAAKTEAPPLDLVMGVFLGNQQLDTNPEQKHCAHDLQERHAQQRQGKGDQGDAQDDCARGTPQNALHALLGLKVATRQGDHDGIVAPQQNVDQDDLEYGGPAHRLQKLKHV
jgi:hypothetical protein